MTGRRWYTRPAPLVTAALLGAAFLAYLPLLHNGFVLYDDHLYITENMRVRAGLTWSNIRWALTSQEQGNWFPLTWLSHLADVQLYDLRAWGHHLTSLLLHLANTALVFFVLRALTGAVGRSAAVAALFALHPLHVESVAWASERKDVLCAFFWLLATAAYVRYARRPAAGRSALVAVLVACSLMSKPLAVTLPLTLLLLDVWPLGRLGPRGTPIARLVLEKLPLVALAAGASVLTYRAQLLGGAVADPALFTPALRVGNAVLAYARYLGKTFWPQKLSVLYFYHSQRAGGWEVAAAGAALAAATLLLVLARRRRPALAIGWLWFLGVLVPMIGLVQVGVQGFADRYTYVPHIGLFVAIVWGLNDLVVRRPRLRPALAGLCVAALVAFGALTFTQAAIWRNSSTLFGQALTVSPDNLMVEMMLGRALTKEGRIEEANTHFLRALERFPGLPEAHLLLGVNFLHRGDRGQAFTHFTEEIQVNPGSTNAHLYLAAIMEQQGRWPEARAHYEAVLQMTSTDASLRARLQDSLSRLGRR